ncbi:MAG: tetratricopeptide repeat protein [Acidobacteria bacterium]|nr:tetratricopeptide repeat protein [Acidobacteriota bacterium]
MNRPAPSIEGARHAVPAWITPLVLFVTWIFPASLGAQTPPSPDVVAHVKAGIQARLEKRYTDARRELEAAAKQAPHIAEIHLNLGLVYHEQGDLGRAITTLRKALDLKPEAKGARSLIGFDLLTLGRYGPAADQLEKAYQEDAAPQVSGWLGLAYLKSGRPSDAIPRLEAALDGQPGDVDLLYYLAKAYSMVSAQLQLTLLRASPDSARAHQATADDHALNGRTDQAIAEYESALKQAPDIVGVHAALGALYRDASRYEEAVRHYEIELDRAPDDLDLRYQYGSVLLQLGRSSEAVPHLQAAVDGEPTRADAQFTLGKALVDQAALDAAMNAFSAVLAAGPTLQQAMAAHYQIGQILRQQDKPEAAAVHLNEFRKLRGQLIRAEQQ